MEQDKLLVLDILDRFIRNRKDRQIMVLYLTDYPGSMERLAEECEVSVSTVKRAVNRNAFIYRHLPGNELKVD